MNWESIPQDQMEYVNKILADLQDHNESTYHHCLRVSKLCRFLAEAAQLSPEDQLVAQFAGLLHDVGKVQTSRTVLNKPARLDETEIREMNMHPVVSAELLDPLGGNPFFRQVQLAVLHHHERIDGNGYPYKLSGEEIPLISRLILVADTLDAMTQDRPYRKGLPMEVAYRELERCSGTQFDSELVQIFVTAHKEATLSDKKIDNVVPIGKLKKAA